MTKYSKALFIGLFLLLFNCEYFKSSKDKSLNKNTINTQENVNLLKEEDHLVKKGLPPDPGKAGEETLLGIDSDGDGIRDDMQRFIYEKYHNQPLLEKALMQYAKDQQNTFRYIDNRQKAIPFIKKMLDSLECLTDIFRIIHGDSSPISDFLRDWMPRFENTFERVKANRLLDSYFSGQTYFGSDLDNPGMTCEFKIDLQLIKNYKEKIEENLKK